MTGPAETKTPPVPAAADAARRRHFRSVAIAVALGALALLFYAATIVRMGGNVAKRPLAVPAVLLGSATR